MVGARTTTAVTHTVVHNPSHHTTVQAHNTTIPTYHPILFCFLSQVHSFTLLLLAAVFGGSTGNPTHNSHQPISFTPHTISTHSSHNHMPYHLNSRCGVSPRRGTGQYTPPTSQLIIRIVVCRFAGGTKPQTAHTTHTQPYVFV